MKNKTLILCMAVMLFSCTKEQPSFNSQINRIEYIDMDADADYGYIDSAEIHIGSIGIGAIKIIKIHGCEYVLCSDGSAEKYDFKHCEGCTNNTANHNYQIK